MGKRSRPVTIAAAADEPDFPEVEQIGYSLELPTADEFVCSGDEVREEFAMLGGACESGMDWASA